jgi:uncharacterized damage-inducible protein DinB
VGRTMAFRSISPLAEARELVDFNRQVFERYARRVRRLPWKEANRDRGTGHLSYFRTLVHILNVQEVWLVYAVRGRNSEMPALWKDESRHPKDWAGFREYSARVWSGVEETLRGLSDRDFDRPARVPWFRQRSSVRDGFFQATFEEAHHIGEIIGAMWQKDEEPPLMMWIPILRTAPRPRTVRRRRG